MATSLYFSKVSKAAAGLRLSPTLAKGPFEPTWESLKQYSTPSWFSNAKFGIWAHWGPQCQPEYGDWYARKMYDEGSDQYQYHLKKYGHPTKFGFKDVINEWKAENWNPDELMALYKKAGAQYFVALANHHDNFDLFDSAYQPWNSVKVGPKKDLIGGWAKAAKAQGLPFGVSVHAAHAWSWFETAQRADKNGPLAYVPYDGRLTQMDIPNPWWGDLDLQDLYAQQHALSVRSEDSRMIHSQWNWSNGVNMPTKAYCEKFLKRTIDLIDKYEPDLLYFDDTALPLWPVNDAGLQIAAHFYNASIKKNGKLKAVINGKVLDEDQRKCMVWDIERGQSNQIEPLPWQTDTCIGDWHYDRRIFDRHGYKSAKTIIHTLCDVVSKNGNLLLNIPVKGDGTIDSDERRIVNEIADWMTVNSECIYDTRPWLIYGEGPAMETSAPLKAQGFNEGKGKPFSGGDFRFTYKANTLYVMMLGQPDSGYAIVPSLSGRSPHLAGKKVKEVSLLGYNEKPEWQQTDEALKVNVPAQLSGQHTLVFKVTGV